jgi:hypothetical protein
VAEIQGAFFQDCQHPIKVVVAERRGPHHAKLICKDCRKFISWVPKPETLQQRKENQEILTSLSKLELPSWERQFVRQLSTLRNISPKQQTKLFELKEIYLKGTRP